MEDNLSNKGSLAPVWWAIAILLVIEIGVRFILDFHLQRVLIVETIAFIAMALYLYAFVQDRPALSHRKRTTLLVLVVAFILGAVRTGLWAAGIGVYWANLTILTIGLAIFLGWLWRRKSQRPMGSRHEKT